tara:strand:+ start:6102 stop:9182 length:3081 start_codon:yes stop_codon:yes gene_type:complete
MNLTKIALTKDRVTYTVIILILFAGLILYNALSRDSMPPYTIRVASVVTVFPGAGPERVESLISEKIETVAQEIPEVDVITSQSRTGLSVVSVALKDNVSQGELQAIWDKLRRKIDNIRADLPSGIYGPDVKDEDVGVVYGIMIGLESDGFDNTETVDYAGKLRDRLMALDDASKVEISGEIEERIFIEFNDAELSNYGISGQQLKNILSSTNIIIPAGEIKLGDERIIMEPTGNLESLADLENLIIPLSNGRESVKLVDITTIKRDYINPKESIVKINGKPGVSVSISLKDGANITKLGEDVDRVLASYNQTLPVGLDAKRIASQDEDVALNINSFVSNVVQSIIIVLLVMFMFLGIRTGLVVASLIPAAILCTLMTMGILNVGLNQVSLAALIMALGMLVDNAIVMAESMMVKMENKMSAINAAISSSQELMIPLLISSLTTSAAFLAFFLAESVMGEIMGQLFVVITIALISSWLMALTIVPLLAVAMIRVKKSKTQKQSIFDKLGVYYKRFLQISLRHPAITLVTIFLLFILSLVGFGKLPFVFMPDSERNLVTMDINLPLGTSIETTREQVEKVEKYIKQQLLTNKKRTKGIKDWSSFIGQGPTSYDAGYAQQEANSGYAHLLINTSSGEENQLVIDSLEKFCLEHLPDVDASISRLGSGGGASTPVAVRVSGPDISELYSKMNAIKSKLRQTPGSKNVDDDWGPKIKKFVVNIDQNKLSQSGLSNQDVAVSLNTSLSGQNVGDFREGDNTIPIIMQSKGNDELSFSNLESITVFGQNSGRSAPLTQIASIQPDWQYARILRRDMNRTITVVCSLKDGYTAGEVTAPLSSWLEKQSDKWGDEYTYEFGGESESSSDAMGAIADKLPIAFFIIILLLIIQFNSMRKTTIVMSTIPLGIIGIVAGLLVTRSNFSFTAFLGVISLAGIVINNAIVLIDRIETELKEENRSKLDSVMYACNERFRPILLTTFTTSLGLIPLWIGGGAMWQPMAIGIIFGLLFATVITLIFVPVMFKIFFKIKKNE